MFKTPYCTKKYESSQREKEKKRSQLERIFTGQVKNYLSIKINDNGFQNSEQETESPGDVN